MNKITDTQTNDEWNEMKKKSKKEADQTFIFTSFFVLWQYILNNNHTPPDETMYVFVAGFKSISCKENISQLSVFV